MTSFGGGGGRKTKGKQSISRGSGHQVGLGGHGGSSGEDPVTCRGAAVCPQDEALDPVSLTVFFFHPRVGLHMDDDVPNCV